MSNRRSGLPRKSFLFTMHPTQYFEKHSRRLVDPGQPIQTRLQMAVDVKDSLEIAHITAEHLKFLKCYFPASSASLQHITKSLFIDYPEHKLRNILVEILDVPVNPSNRSFKIITKNPLAVMFLFQLYSRLVQTNIPHLLSVMISAISVPQPENVPSHLRPQFIELKGAQIMTVSFLTYVLVSCVEYIRPHEESICKSISNLLVTCSDSACIREELLASLKFVFGMDFKRGLCPFTDTLLDERVLIGAGRDCSEPLRPLAYSLLADIVHLQVEPIFEEGVDQQSMDEEQILLGRTLYTFVGKFSTFKLTIPQLLEEGEVGKDRVTLRAKLRISVQAVLNLQVLVLHSKEVNDCKNLIKTLVMGTKSIIWSITHSHVPRTQGMNPQGLASQSPAPKGFKGRGGNEVCKASSVLRSGVHYLALFKEKDEEKDIMLNLFSQILALMEPRDIMDMFSLCMPELFKCINKNQLVQIFGALLQASKVYKPFADVLINLLVSRTLDVLKNLDSDASKLVLHQFRCIFGAVTKIPSDFERNLQQHMPYTWVPTSQPSTPFLVPLEKFIKVAVAAVNQGNPGTCIYYRKQALKFLRVCLLSLLNLHSYVTDVGPGRLSTLLHSSVECHRSESEVTKADLEVQTKTHIMAVKSIFKTLLQHVQPSGSDLCDLDSLHIQMIRTMLSFLHHMPLLLLLSWTSCCSAATTDRSLLHHHEPIEPLLIVDRAWRIYVMHQSGNVICSFSSMWLLAMFLAVVVVVYIFMRFSSKGKGLEKDLEKKLQKSRNVKKRTNTKSVPCVSESGKDAIINERTKKRSVSYASGSGEGDVTKKETNTESVPCAPGSGNDAIINEHIEKDSVHCASGSGEGDVIKKETNTESVPCEPGSGNDAIINEHIEKNSVPYASSGGSGEGDVIKKETNTKSGVSGLAENDLSQWYNPAISLLALRDDEAQERGKKVTDKLFVSDTKIENGSNDYKVFEGNYERRLVAVKCLHLSRAKAADMNEIEILCASDDHSNIIRLHGFEHDQDFLYICLERWTCNLDDLIRLTMRKFSKSPKAVAPLDSWEEAMEKFNFWKAVGNPLPLMLKLLRDIVSGLAHMHELKIVHRDLKPQNVLILAKGTNLTAKIYDFVISKRLNEDSSSTDDQPTCHGSPGWQAPEQLRKNDANEAVDMFRFGCILCYAITGSHPFGDSHRDTNILNNNQVNLSHVKHPEASILIYQLLNPKPNLRPTATEVLLHPMFWDSAKRLSFLRDASDRLMQAEQTILDAVESKKADVLNGVTWDNRLHKDLVTYITPQPEPAKQAKQAKQAKKGQQAQQAQEAEEDQEAVKRFYKYNRLRHLLRLIRNILNHYREMPPNIQQLVGTVPNGLDYYFASRFPKLLMEIHKVIFKYCREEDQFKKYF